MCAAAPVEAAAVSDWLAGGRFSVTRDICFDASRSTRFTYMIHCIIHSLMHQVSWLREHISSILCKSLHIGYKMDARLYRQCVESLNVSLFSEKNLFVWSPTPLFRTSGDVAMSVLRWESKGGYPQLLHYCPYLIAGADRGFSWEWGIINNFFQNLHEIKNILDRREGVPGAPPYFRKRKVVHQQLSSNMAH